MHQDFVILLCLMPDDFTRRGHLLLLRGLICVEGFVYLKEEIKSVILWFLDLFWQVWNVAFTPIPNWSYSISINFSSWSCINIYYKWYYCGNWICTVWLHPGKCNCTVIYCTVKVLNPLCSIYCMHNCNWVNCKWFFIFQNMKVNVVEETLIETWIFQYTIIIKIYCKLDAKFLKIIYITWVLHIIVIAL